MKNLFTYFAALLLFSGCSGSSPSAPVSADAPLADLPADSSDQYYDPEYKMPPVTNWVLQRINGQEVTTADIRGERPTLQINLEDGKARGFGGCNRFNAHITLEGNKINFGHIMTTRMTCPSFDLETAYLGIFRFGLLTYRWRPGKLFIQRDVRSVLEFSPAQQ